VNLLTPQNAILAVGVLLLIAPAISGAAASWISAIVWRPSNRIDFEKNTIADLVDLRERLERDGQIVAARLCRELMFSLINGGNVGPPRREPAAPANYAVVYGPGNAPPTVEAAP
jgi:hypothetical protein